jgi:hypothetical protein
MGPWSMKSKLAKTAIGKACAKIFDIEAIPDVKADNPYFVVAVKETQRVSKYYFHLFFVVLIFLYAIEFGILHYFQVRVSPSPPGGK